MLHPQKQADLWREVLPLPSCLPGSVKQLNTGVRVATSNIQEETAFPWALRVHGLSQKVLHLFMDQDSGVHLTQL